MLTDLSGDGRADVAAADYNHGLVVLRSASTAVPVSATRYLERVYRDVLGRPPTSAETARWAPGVGNAAARYDFAIGLVNTSEFRTRLVAADAQAYLGHAPEPGLSAALVDAMAKRSPAELSAVIMLGSEEFYARHNRSPERFVDALFGLLGRAPGSAERVAWANLIRGGYNRTITALTFIVQPDARALFIHSVYQRYLGRPAEASVVGAWTSLLAAGAPSTLVSAWLVTSDEYWSRATT